MKKPKTGSTINGQPLKITDSWEKMNFGQYLRIIKLKDDNIELISILTGLDYDTVKKAKLTGLDKLLYISSFINTPPVFPTKITHIGQYKIPLNKDGIFDIQFESLAQFEDMRQIMYTVPQPKENETTEQLQERIYLHTKAYATYAAIYCQKLRDGDYDGFKAMVMAQEIMDYPASHIITAGSFFFVKLTILLNGTVKSFPTIAQVPKKHTGKTSKKNSGRTPRSTRLRGR